MTNSRRGSSKRMHPHLARRLALALSVVFVGLLLPISEPVEAMNGPGGFVPLSPARILSTRDGIGDVGTTLVGGGFYDQQILGRGGVPASGVDTVVMNVTVIAGATPGYLILYPSGGSFPPTSNVNFAANQIVPNLVHVKVGPNGKVSFFSSVGSVHVIFDVAGYYTASGRPDAGGFVPLDTPERLFDSRVDATFDTGGANLGVAPLGPNDTVLIDVDDDNEIDALILNVTATGATERTHVTVFPGGAGVTPPNASNLNIVPQQTVANAVTARLGSSGSFVVYNNTGSIHVIVDVVGYLLKPHVGGLQDRFVGVAPSRILSTRDGIGTSGKIGAAALNFKVTGRGNVPNSSSVHAVVLNVTATNTDRAGYFTVYPGDITLPATSSLNFSAGQSVANQVVVKVSAAGFVRVQNSSGTADVIFDVFGYFQNAATSPASTDDGEDRARVMADVEGAPTSPGVSLERARPVRVNVSGA